MRRKPLHLRAQRVRRYTRKDGTLVERRYAAWVEPDDTPIVGDTVEAVIAAWQQSPRWKKLAEASRTSYAHDCKHLAGIAKGRLREVTRRHLLAIRDFVIDNHGMGAGNSFACAVGSLCSFAVDYGIIDASPATRLRKDIELNELPAWTQQQYELAIRHLPERLRRAVVLAAHTAQRSGDCQKMKWADYDGSHITVTQQKSGKSKKKQVTLRIRVTAALKAELDAWRPKVVDLKGKALGHILLTDAGEPWRGTNLAVQLATYLGRIPDFPPHLSMHGLRKLAATNLAQAGGSTHQIAAVTGHRDLQMVAYYTKSLDQTLAGDAAIAKLEAWQAKVG